MLKKNGNNRANPIEVVAMAIISCRSHKTWKVQINIGKIVQTVQNYISHFTSFAKQHTTETANVACIAHM